MDQVGQGANYTDVTVPIRNASGALVTDGLTGTPTVTLTTLRDSADVDRRTGATLTYAGDGAYRITKAIPADGALLSWWGVITYDDGAGFVRTYPFGFTVVTAAQADPAAGLAALPVGGTSGTWGAALALVRSNVVDGVVPEALDASLRITQGHDYLLADDRHFLWTTNEAATWPTLTGATIEFVIDQRIRDATAAGAVVQATGTNKSVRVELPQSFTRALRTGRFVFGVEATLASGSRIGLVGGTADVVTV